MWSTASGGRGGLRWYPRALRHYGSVGSLHAGPGWCTRSLLPARTSHQPVQIKSPACWRQRCATPTPTANMSSENPIIVGTTNGNSNAPTAALPRSAGASRGEGSNVGTFGVKSGLAQMLKGGVIMVGTSAARATQNELLTSTFWAGCGQPRAGAHRRGGRCCGRHGARARAG